MFRLKKGIINRSSNIVCMNLLFLVRAVGFTIELMMMSYNPPPICFNIKIFNQGMLLSFEKPNNGLVKITPLTLMEGLSSNNLQVTNPPKL